MLRAPRAGAVGLNDAGNRHGNVLTQSGRGFTTPPIPPRDHPETCPSASGAPGCPAAAEVGEVLVIRSAAVSHRAPPVAADKPRVATVLIACALIVCNLVAVGCRLAGGRPLMRPSFDRQQRTVLGVVPFGTPREQTVRRLEQAGVDGSFGISESVYYCDLWEHAGAEADWRMDMALFFDQSGRFYKVGRGQSQTGVVGSAGGDRSGQSRTAGRSSRPTGSRGAKAAELAAGSDRSDEDRPRTPTSAAPAGRAGRRTPFVDPADLR